MKKYLQNKVAESKLALPAMIVFAVMVWLSGGLLVNQWWLSFGCFFIATYLMVEFNNTYSLIRIYSRMVSCVFLALSCMACFLFAHTRGAITEVCFIGALMLLFSTYQEKSAAGITYYSFLLFGIASFTFIHTVFFLPLLWLLMATLLQSLSWRTWAASLLGILTPYWIGCVWLVWTEDFTPLINHVSALADFQPLTVLPTLPFSHQATLSVTVLLAVIGIVHCIRQQRYDSIRIRMFYGFFIWLFLATLLFLVLQPQHFDPLVRILFVCASPLVAHFLSLTHTKVTNIAFFAITALILIVTTYNLWTYLSHS